MADSNHGCPRLGNDPDIAVVIPTYNREAFVSQAINSVLGQTRPPAQIVVVDDGSTDSTSRVLAAYGNRIRILRQPNAGKAAALNTALATLESDYVLILDDDDVALPDALERHVSFLRANTNIDFTYSGCYSFEGSEPPAQPDASRLYSGLETTASEFFIRCLETFPFLMGGMLVPLSCYRAVGPFDESLTFGQDYEMILRLARRWRGGKLANPTFLLRQHSQPRGPARERREASEREAAWRVYEKMTFSRLRDELALEEYLPRDAEPPAMTSRTRRLALLQRACIMARHGLFRESLDDLEAALESTSARLHFSARERAICSRMLDLEPDLLQGREAWIERVSQLLRNRRNGPLADACIAGLSWSLEREWKRRSYSGFAVVAQSLFRLAGARLLPMMTMKTWARFSKKPRLAHE